ncbi:MAG: DNA cytosine methyltransferase [Acidobacteria bacterium]|nr:DNA cytosine methyltransferase [Acidobacteriota bacterium]
MQTGTDFASLYCGAGGLDLGFMAAGFRCLAAFDADAAAVATYNRNLGCHASTVDLRSCDPDVANALKRADLVLAGPPCQGFSTAGRNDPEDERNLHLQRVAELAAGSVAKVVVIENVKGLLGAKYRIQLDSCLATLRESGFEVSCRLFDFSEYGVAQTRRRVIILGTRGIAPVSLDGIRKRAKRTLRDAIGNGTQASNGQASNGQGGMRLTAREVKIASQIAPGQRLTNVRSGPRSVHTWSIPEVFGGVSEHEMSVLEAMSRLRRRQRRREVGDADPIRAEQVTRYLGKESDATLCALVDRGYVRRKEGRFDLTHTFNGKYKRLQWDECAPTVDTRFIEPRYFLHPEECRGFSVAEMAALQDFPRTYVFPDCLTTSSRLIGNAVPPRFAELLARQISLSGTSQ